MTTAIRSISLVVATVLVGLSAGFFFTYQASILLGLAEVDDVTYVKTFQALNSTIRNPYFALVFFGAVPAMGFALAANWRSNVVRLAIGAAIVMYLATIAITGSGNVPLNEDLEGRTDRSPAAAAEAREVFEDDWNRLNLYRTATTIGAFVALAAAPAVARLWSDAR